MTAASLVPFVDVVLRGAAMLLPVREAAGANNAGRFVEAILKLVGLKAGQPWCMAFVSYVGRMMLGRLWTLPMTGSCDVFLEAARRAGILYDTPKAGDVFLRLRSAHDADHAGFVELVKHDRFGTIEGNTTPRRGRDSNTGDGVYRLERGEPGDPARYVFVRWVEMLGAA